MWYPNYLKKKKTLNIFQEAAHCRVDGGAYI